MLNKISLLYKDDKKFAKKLIHMQNDCFLFLSLSFSVRLRAYYEMSVFLIHLTFLCRQGSKLIIELIIEELRKKFLTDKICQSRLQ